MEAKGVFRMTVKKIRLFLQLVGIGPVIIPVQKCHISAPAGFEAVQGIVVHAAIAV